MEYEKTRFWYLNHLQSFQVCIFSTLLRNEIIKVINSLNVFNYAYFIFSMEDYLKIIDVKLILRKLIYRMGYVVDYVDYLPLEDSCVDSMHRLRCSFVIPKEIILGQCSCSIVLGNCITFYEINFNQNLYV